MRAQNTATLLWLGAGDLATRCLPLLRAEDISPIFVSRSPKPIGAGGETWEHGDLSNAGDALRLAQLKPEYCVVSFSPKGRREEDYQHAYLKSLKNILQAFSQIHHAPRLVIFVSSTSVYHQNRGEWVNEDSACAPTGHSGRTMLACEALLSQQNFQTCALRFSGIYGPSRFHLLRQVCAGQSVQNQWTNRIHAQDCARVIHFLISRAIQNESMPKVVLASDDQPVAAHDVRHWLAGQLARPELQATYIEAPDQNYKGKRCQNSLLKSLGFKCQYTNYKQGFSEIIDSFNTQLAYEAGSR